MFPNFPFPFFPIAFRFPIFPFPFNSSVSFFPFPFYPDLTMVAGRGFFIKKVRASVDVTSRKGIVIRVATTVIRQRLVQWLLTTGLLHLVQQPVVWARRICSDYTMQYTNI